jgi:non-canonical (house-cleaning) NTP pyrophosphatase
MGLGTPPMYQLPDRMVQELLAGVELGEVMDRAMGEENTKQKGGAVSFFTHGLMDRQAIYTLGVTLALVPFINRELYFGW